MPSSPDEDARDAGADGVVHVGLAPAPLNRYPSLVESAVSQPFPLPSGPSPSLPTPHQEHQLDLSLNFAGSALPSTNVSLPTPSIIKAGHNLRLPSFELLGIAAPHPDRIPLRQTHSFSSLGAGPLSKPEDPLHALSPALSRAQLVGADGTPSTANPETLKAQVVGLIPTVTPPTEPGTFNWGSIVKVKTTAIGSPPSSDPGVSPNMTFAVNASSAAPTPNSMPLPSRPAITKFGDTTNMVEWVESAQEALTSEFESWNLESVKLLSHALPCPSLTGHIFAQVIASVHEKTNTPTAWVNVFHAVPGRFTLSDLPKSPPSTPGTVVGGDEYFTSKIFDSAVAVPDYQLDSKLLPPSPRPVVPPGSVNISIVERYIPPTNINEFAEIFTVNGRSLLYDRLIELSPHNGTLLFVYPTKTGARTFMNEYLGPVLDPLLRTITVVHELSSDLGKTLGTMTSVERLSEYEALHAAIGRFCDELSNGKASLHPSSNQISKYSLIHAAKEEMLLGRSTWAEDWWIKQEKPRVREVVAKFLRKAKKLPGECEITPTNLISEVLDGVAHREYEGSGPSRGVEVGVFVIKKSS
ncbi:uncharacterized protein BDR25DRAFT_310843 [Lindgomyces ingoldianus]|uniref:Uncharacterized protein n=1 Tax=Lindgomyces ingoldianus TaxID=673940 RepID=A0ACB6R9R4_9PLEO|nr:uncharacterized protein BDR25DRAFT_310843 [Lindgomyces ingoldianus]KAF2475480.1 hypothetical protein BDR25DRAFT_310843 [Lindgomyces ingoldianus]